MPGQVRNAALFVQHLDDLRFHLRRYRKIRVVCGNAKLHDCRRVWQCLRRWGRRVELHFVPPYCPQANPIERIPWHLHEEITRSHRRRELDALLDLVFTWPDHRSPLAIEDQTYNLKPAA